MDAIRTHPRTLLLTALCAASLWVTGCEDLMSMADEAADAKASKTSKDAKDTKAAKDADNKALLETKADSTAPTKAAGDAAEDANLVTLVRSFKTCVDECHEGGSTSETDQETCRLNCEQLADTAKTELSASHQQAVDKTVPMIKDALVSCSKECQADKKLSKDDRETCKLNCSGSVGALVDTLVYAETGEPAERGEQSCDETCAARRELCEKGCADQRVRATDRETCKLMCGANVGFCTEACNAKAAEH